MNQLNALSNCVEYYGHFQPIVANCCSPVAQSITMGDNELEAARDYHLQNGRQGIGGNREQSGEVSSMELERADGIWFMPSAFIFIQFAVRQEGPIDIECFDFCRAKQISTQLQVPVVGIGPVPVPVLGRVHAKTETPFPILDL